MLVNVRDSSRQFLETVLEFKIRRLRKQTNTKIAKNETIERERVSNYHSTHFLVDDLGERERERERERDLRGLFLLVSGTTNSPIFFIFFLTKTLQSVTKERERKRGKERGRE